MKIFCLFSVQRTGTNYLHSVLRQWPALASFDELFHVARVFGLKPAQLQALSKAAGQEFVASRQNDVGQEFTNWARRHPLEVVDTLQRVLARKDRPAMMFKIFNGQWLPPPEGVIGALARRPGFVPIVLKRRCIDCYVSLRKAQVAGKFKHLETTHAPVSLDAAAYERWAAEARAWYRLVDQALAQAGRSALRRNYEQDIDLPPATLSTHWANLLELAPAPEIDESLAIARQDRSDGLKAKIANHDEFVAALAKRGLWEEPQSASAIEAG